MGPTRHPLLWTVGVALLCAALLFPFYWMLVTAVLPTSQVLAREPTLVPALSGISMRAFRRTQGLPYVILRFSHTQDARELVDP